MGSTKIYSTPSHPDLQKLLPAPIILLKVLICLFNRNHLESADSGNLASEAGNFSTLSCVLLPPTSKSAFKGMIHAVGNHQWFI
jgi:hypothetical protein